ncbi:MAG: hypothetical protein QHH06_13615 [Clostridiales bacterium]|nr:hypothetical protein [Eubacteriales bacterium]MDH7567479.1 hypothetical protein [Clostridiales bacterium]
MADPNADIDNIRNDKNEPIPQTIYAVKARLNEVFSECSDFMHRKIVCGKGGSIRMLMAYINGFVDKRVLQMQNCQTPPSSAKGSRTRN